MTFLIDTDALVHISHRPNGNAVCDQLIPYCQVGDILTVAQVFDEMKRFPEVRERFWPYRDSMLIDQYQEEVMSFVGYISDSFEFLYDLSGSANPDPADPWLIAGARVFGHTLVTDERRQSTKKIPFVCRQQNVDVECINGAELLDRLAL